MTYHVTLIAEAEDDLVAIHEYIARNDSLLKADRLLDRLLTACWSLTEHPFRGHVPPELDRAGNTRFRQIHFKPYRIIYEAIGNRVFIHAVLDGRRDVRDALEWRLLRP